MSTAGTGHPDQHTHELRTNGLACLAISVALGSALGVASGNLAVGVALGVGLFIFMAAALCRNLRG